MGAFVITDDSTRVHLSTAAAKSGSDYINANFCDVSIIHLKYFAQPFDIER